MRNIYVVVYIHADNALLHNILPNNNFTNSLDNVPIWFYDKGDDPSFYCSEVKKTNLSWGVCRPNIRNKIQPEDVVVFFCFNSTTNIYYLAGLASVSEKIKQTQIWTDENYSNYRQYYNLLMRLNNNSWEYYEPIDKHDDWLSRISKKRLNTDFIVNENSISVEYEILPNYVIFNNDIAKTYILKKQIPVANWQEDANNEVWKNTQICNTIWEFIFTGIKRQTLRCHARYHPHVHIRISKSQENFIIWINGFIKFLRDSDNHFE
jgi:hypothetical protein